MNNLSKFQLYRRLLGYLKPFSLLYGVCAVINGGALFLVFSSVGVLLREIMEISIGTESIGKLPQISMYLVGTLAFALISGLSLVGFTYIEQKIQAVIREEMMVSYLHGEEKATQEISSLEVLNRISTDLPNCVRLVGYYMDGWIFTPIMSGSFSLLLLLRVNASVALITFLCAGLNVFVVQFLSGKQQHQSKKIIEEKSRLIVLMQECVKGALEVRSLSLWKHFEKEQEKQLEEIQKRKMMVGMYQAFRRAAVVIATDCITIVSLLLVGGLLSRQGKMDFSDIMLALPLSDQIGQMLVAFGNFQTILRVNAPYMERVFEVVDLPQENYCKNKNQQLQFPKYLRLENVSFAYQDQPVLDRVSLTIPFGKRIAFVGDSGSGKSTVLKLLLRLYQPDAGSIFLGNETSEHFSLEEWRSLFSYMPQETSFFQKSVAENISMESGADIERIKEAAELVIAEEFLRGKQEGYETLLGQEQECFSGGQLQRIALARSFYRNASFLLLDEPTSALDTGTATMVQAAIRLVGKDRTVIAVTHRLELAIDFDEIYVMEKGKIVEHGTHDKLIEKGGKYTRMWNTYMKQ